MTENSALDPGRALWQSQTTPPFHMTPEELRRSLRRLGDPFYDSPLGIIAMLVVLFCMTLTVFVSPYLIDRVGFGLLLLGVIYMLGELWINDRNMRTTLTAAATGDVSPVDFYRAELERMLRLARRAWVRIVILSPGMFIIYCGGFFHLRSPTKLTLFGILVLSYLIVIVAGIRTSRKKAQQLRHQIDEVGMLCQPSGPLPNR